MTIYKTLKANLKRAVRDNTLVHAGGGEFTPAEIKQFLATLDQMEACVQECEPRPDSFDFGPAYAGAVRRREAVLKEIT